VKPTNRLVHHFLETSAEQFPDKLAVVHEQNRVEYSRINRRANQLAHSLILAGVNRGDRVVILCGNSIEYIFCYYGILKAGCIAVSLNTDLRPDSIAVLLSELKPKVLIVSSRFARVVRNLDLPKFFISRLFFYRCPSVPSKRGGSNFIAA